MERISKGVQMLDSITDINLFKHIENHTKEWIKWINLSEPQDFPLPKEMNKISYFKKCLIIRAFRPEKLMFMMKQFIKHRIGDTYANPPPVKLSDIYPDTESRAPIIFILSKGADPSDTIKDLAKTKGKDQNIRELSLGSGSEEKAKMAIQKGSMEGNWVILCNCHLFEDWLPQLLIECDNLKDPNSKCNEEFRLFLTARPCNKFPIPILQSGTKIAYEPPKGLKKNMLGSLLKYNDEYFSGNKNDINFKRLAFGTVFMHACILERKK